MLGELADKAGLGEVEAVVMPAADSETVEWLQGVGSVAAAMPGATTGLWSDGAEACRSVAEELDGLGTPSELLDAASGTPDEVTREVLVSLHSAIGRMLAACGDATAFEAELPNFAWQWSLADRRLTEIGVER